MKFRGIQLHDVLGELQELPSSWMDDVAREVVDLIRSSFIELRSFDRPVTTKDLEDQLAKNRHFLDVCRLVLGRGQEPVAHQLHEELGGKRKGWSDLKKLATKEPSRLAAALARIGVAEEINEFLRRRWEPEDVLIDRYRLTRGRAISGQSRGRGLEDEVQKSLVALEVSFERGVTFAGKEGRTAKCDFAVPTKQHPKIVIEAKGFEATGSKLTDFLGDILKIGEAREPHMYFFLVTDGRGWHNRESDLRRIVQFHVDGLIDMIYTLKRLPELAKAVRHIIDTEL